MLTSIRFFKHYLAAKIFRLWRANVRCGRAVQSGSAWMGRRRARRARRGTRTLPGLLGPVGPGLSMRLPPIKGGGRAMTQSMSAPVLPGKRSEAMDELSQAINERFSSGLMFQAGVEVQILLNSRRGSGKRKAESGPR